MYPRKSLVAVLCVLFQIFWNTEAAANFNDKTRYIWGAALKITFWPSFLSKENSLEHRNGSSFRINENKIFIAMFRRVWNPSLNKPFVLEDIKGTFWRQNGMAQLKRLSPCKYLTWVVNSPALFGVQPCSICSTPRYAINIRFRSPGRSFAVGLWWGWTLFHKTQCFNHDRGSVVEE